MLQPACCLESSSGNLPGDQQPQLNRKVSAKSEKEEVPPKRADEERIKTLENRKETNRKSRKVLAHKVFNRHVRQANISKSTRTRLGTATGEDGPIAAEGSGFLEAGDCLNIYFTQLTTEMYGRHRCLFTCIYIVLLLHLHHVLAAQRHYKIKRQDGRLMAYRGGESEIRDYATYATAGTAAGAVSGAAVGVAVGTFVPVIGNVVGGIWGMIYGGGAGFVGGSIAYLGVQSACDNRCAKGTYACVTAENVSMPCCRTHFTQQCYSDWGEIEAKYPRLTTPRPTPPPVIAIYNPYWSETFAGPGIKEDANLTKVTPFWCKRARRNSLEYFISEKKCPYETNRCYFVVCTTSGKADGNRQVAEWGCVPKNMDLCGSISSLITCSCILTDPDVAMGNERYKFEPLTG
uniref:Glycine zipper domain-containing protein n=1 Tax=Globodera rostochiensis TaxID=31243 RepID=A0A914I0N9_GLORO